MLPQVGILVELDNTVRDVPRACSDQSFDPVADSKLVTQELRHHAGDAVSHSFDHFQWDPSCNTMRRNKDPRLVVNGSKIVDTPEQDSGTGRLGDGLAQI